jgi:hypothetical protein
LLTVQDPFPSSAAYTPPASLSTLSPNIVTPNLQDWNFTLQQALDKIGTFTAAYAGSKGTHLMRSLDLNQPPPGPGPLSSREPYPNFANIFYTESSADSEFQSLQLSFNRTLHKGLSVMANYMFSKSMDDTSAFLGTPADPNFPQNSHDYHAEHALSSFDEPNYATVAMVYQLPWRNRWLRNTDVRSILTARSGQPFTPLVAADNSNTGNVGGNFGTDRPDVVGSPYLASPGPQEWFNTAAFVVNPLYTFGDAGRNILRGPGSVTLDLELARRFILSERFSMTFEAQAFNSLNRVNFDLPQLYVDDPTTFGKIFSAEAPRQIQFALRLGF